MMLPWCASHLHQLQIKVHGVCFGLKDSLFGFLSTEHLSRYFSPLASPLLHQPASSAHSAARMNHRKNKQRGLLLTPTAAYCSPGPGHRLWPHRLQSKPRAHLYFLLLFTLRDRKGTWPVLRVASELARILQGNKTNRMYPKIWEDLLWGIGSVTEAEKSHDLQSASRRPRKAGGVVPVDLRTRGPWSKVLVWV